MRACCIFYHLGHDLQIAADHIADTPAGHSVGLRETVNDQCMILHSGSLSNTIVLSAIKENVLIYFI